MLLMAKEVVPVFCRVTDFGALLPPMSCSGNVRLVTDRFPAPPITPVPLNAKEMLGLTGSFVTIDSVPASTPADAGLNVTLMLQLVSGATSLFVQLFVAAKLPEAEIDVINREAPP